MGPTPWVSRKRSYSMPWKSCIAEVWALPFMELEQNCSRCMPAAYAALKGRNELNRWKNIRIRYPQSCLVLFWHWSKVTYSYDFERVYAWMCECMHVSMYLSFVMHVLTCVKTIHFCTSLEIFEPKNVVSHGRSSSLVKKSTLCWKNPLLWKQYAGMHQIMGKSLRLARFCPSFGYSARSCNDAEIFVYPCCCVRSSLGWDGCWDFGGELEFFFGHFMWWNKSTVL